MRWTKVKHPAEVKLTGVKIDAEIEDETLVGLTLTDANGVVVKVQASEIYSKAMTVLVPAGPETVERYVLKGTIRGLKVREAFDSDWDARQRKSELEDLEGAVKNDGDGLEVVKMQVPVDETTGEINTDEIPF